MPCKLAPSIHAPGARAGQVRLQTHLRKFVHKVRIRVIRWREIPARAQIEYFGNSIQRLLRASVFQQELKAIVHRKDAVAQGDVAGSHSLDKRSLKQRKHLGLRHRVAEMLRVNHVA